MVDTSLKTLIPPWAQIERIKCSLFGEPAHLVCAFEHEIQFLTSGQQGFTHFAGDAGGNLIAMLLEVAQRRAHSGGTFAWRQC